MIEKHYDSFESFCGAFVKAVNNRTLPGWIWLGLAKKSDNLIIQQTNNEDNPLMTGVVDVNSIPVFGIDLWEHAWFHQYKGDKNAYAAAFLNQLDWEKISANFEKFNMNKEVAPVLEF